MYLITVSIVFNCFWFTAVLGRQQSTPYLLLLLTLLFMNKPKSVVPVAGIAIIGILGDSILTQLGIFAFESILIPLWLSTLWFGFASYLFAIKYFLLQYSAWIVSLFGAIGGAISYIAGAKLGAVNLNLSLFSTSMTLFTAWFCYSMVFILILKKYVQDDANRNVAQKE